MSDGRATADASGRFWRQVWRLHFYAGLFSIPMLVMLAVTGLLILYTGPIERAVNGELHHVSVTGAAASLDAQRVVAEAAFPLLHVTSVVPASTADQTSRYVMTKDGDGLRDVYVDPYGPRVVGSHKEGVGVIGLANRLHGSLNTSSWTVPLPSIEGITGDGPAFTHVAVGDVVVEVFACWGLVLAISGLYLWWPRKRRTGKALFVPRLRKQGRARWRDLHAIPGIVLSFLIVFFVTTGMPWSSFWGANFSFLGSRLTPPPAVDAPSSSAVKTGELDRFGNAIPWAILETPIPASDPGVTGHVHGSGGGATVDQTGRSDASALLAASMSLDSIARVAAEERMKPGYTISLPINDTAANGDATYGAYVLSNAWPARLADEQTVYVDQFNGHTLLRTDADAYGGVGKVTELGVVTHMGTQYGLATRIIMTGGCVLLLWSIVTATVMWWKRRPTGKAGLPRRPSDVRLRRGLIVVAVFLGLVYPLWGASFIVVLLIDRYVIRSVPRLRRAFGQRAPA